MSKSKKLDKVLLMEDITGLGSAGEVVEVAPGHARNFLIPLHKAAVPSDENLRILHARRQRLEADVVARQEALVALADRIPDTNVTIEMKVSADGKLYGSVTNQLVAEAMVEAGLPITAQNVRLETPIKEIGQFDVPIHVYGEVEVNARIWVVSTAD